MRKVGVIMSNLSARGGANLKYVRKLRGLTANQLASLMMERFGVSISPSALSKYESGKLPISQEMVAQFAFCLDCSIATLMDGLDLTQNSTDSVHELRKLPPDVHEIFYWVATQWHGDIVALVTAFGQYAAVPEEYRKAAMLELLTQKEQAIIDGAMAEASTPECVKRNLPHLEDLLGALYKG